MKLSDKARIANDVLARKVGEETVMLHLTDGTYFGLDPVGTRIWELLGEGKSLSEICDAMIDEYDVSRDAIERDVITLAEELAARGLIVPV
ncbi:MAG: hypothetical protein A3G25_21730 [Betaproteobacteria bacterium RIFCSPLOWO2_12_FULL_63_13]|nr:MAG: hypothetical protein A3H32_19740 [Betaproteobacteria bacterium RIFCSPLOWO2_02_FULL_63_19]OGA46637.1 MAG: hypothetical protein A3G25_21730 [Betaproteobacteria bacterium RIFCSPLOWO2_12_FULL_63_13]